MFAVSRFGKLRFGIFEAGEFTIDRDEGGLSIISLANWRGDFIADWISGRMASNSSPHEGSIAQFTLKTGKDVIA